MVVPEALSHGVPVLCFDNFGPGENVDDRCAVKVPYSSYDQSEERFSIALEYLLQDEKRRSQMAANARSYFFEHFTWQEKAQRIQAIYADCLSFGTAFAKV